MNKQPEAYITVRKNRQKIYDANSVYLKDNTEFELELFNPTRDVYLAKISINGKSISTSGLVLYPGKREFLERYFDEAMKFKFSTYEVENSKEVNEAIKDNGLIEIEFFKETDNYQGHSIYIPPCEWVTPNVYPPNAPYYGITTTNTGVYTSGNVTLDDSISSNSVNYNSVDMDNISLTGTQVNFDNSIECSAKETGRVDKGSKSNDKFDYVNKSFQTWNSYTITYEILPISTKIDVIGDIRVYCTSCGTKRRKDSWTFCPNCGSKYN